MCVKKKTRIFIHPRKEKVSKNVKTFEERMKTTIRRYEIQLEKLRKLALCLHTLDLGYCIHSVIHFDWLLKSQSLESLSPQGF